MALEEFSLIVDIQFELTFELEYGPNKDIDRILERIYNEPWAPKIAKLAEAGQYSINSAFVFKDGFEIG